MNETQVSDAGTQDHAPACTKERADHTRPRQESIYRALVSARCPFRVFLVRIFEWHNVLGIWQLCSDILVNQLQKEGWEG